MNLSRTFKEVSQLPSKRDTELFGDVHMVVEVLSREVIMRSASKGEVADLCEDMMKAIRDPDALLTHRTAVSMRRWNKV